MAIIDYTKDTNTGVGVEVDGDVELNAGGNQILSGVPTTDPVVTDALWSDDGTLVFSGHTAGGDAVDSVFSRDGVVEAAASDYDASQIDNDSSVDGAFVDDALNNLKDSLGVVTTGSIAISASDQVMDSFLATSDGTCEWAYKVTQDGNIRGGIIVAIWDASTSEVSFTDTHPDDIGTPTVSFDVDHDGTNLRLLATNSDASNAYTYEATRRLSSGISGYGAQALTDPKVLQRVDNMQWETAQTGVEYFSPDKQGTTLGKIVRQYFSGTDLLTELGGELITGASYQVGGGGYQTSSDSKKYPWPFYSTIVSYYKSDGFAIATNWTGPYEIWVDYVKTTEPTTRPTGQPFADPNSPMLKRVDTGVWEIPVAEVDYYALVGPTINPNKRVKILLFDWTIFLAGPTTVLLTRPDDSMRILSCDGYTLYDDKVRLIIDAGDLQFDRNTNELKFTRNVNCTELYALRVQFLANDV